MDPSTFIDPYLTLPDQLVLQELLKNEDAKSVYPMSQYCRQLTASRQNQENIRHCPNATVFEQS
jgi:hypothetical protein